MKKIISNRPAFTILELLLVVTVVAILAAAAIPYINNTLKKQYIEEARATLESIRTRLRLVRNTSGSFAKKSNGNDIITGAVVNNVPYIYTGNLAGANFKDSDYTILSITDTSFVVQVKGSNSRVQGVIFTIDQDGNITGNTP